MWKWISIILAVLIAFSLAHGKFVIHPKEIAALTTDTKNVNAEQIDNFKVWYLISLTEKHKMPLVIVKDATPEDTPILKILAANGLIVATDKNILQSNFVKFINHDDINTLEFSKTSVTLRSENPANKNPVLILTRRENDLCLENQFVCHPQAEAAKIMVEFVKLH